ncbi:GDSL-type esterase/lipase family protein [bacterium]|nr:GDSL-type esterase/lipase family protein [bacterium]
MRIKVVAAVLFVALAWIGYYSYTDSHRKIVNYPPPATGPIVALGDSLTFGTGADSATCYPTVLGKMIGRPIVNKGVPGDKIADAAARLDRDVLKLKPSIVIVFLGGNDVLQQLPLDRSFQDLERIVRRIQEKGAMVVLVGIRALSPIGGLGARYHALARETGCVYIDDALDDILTDVALRHDQIHPNAKGYHIVAERIAAAMKPYLK